MQALGEIEYLALFHVGFGGLPKVIGLGVMSGGAYLVGRIHGWIDAVKLTAKLTEIGCEVMESDDAVRVSASKRLRNTNVKTLPYPGFPTDMQPQIGVALCLARGTSIVTESIFENRFKYVDELTKMGGNVKVEGNTAIIVGVPKYTAANIVSPDLRAGAGLVVAALLAKGKTIEETRQEVGMKIMNDFTEALVEVGHIEKKPSLEGNVMSCVLAPKKK